MRAGKAFLLSLLGFGGLLLFALFTKSWALLSFSLLAGFFLFWCWQFERGVSSPREVALVAALGALAAGLRVPFSALPSVQPVTFLAVAAGRAFGPRVGFMVGAVAALASNFFLGQGPWTPWQMLAWGLGGIAGGMLSRAPRIFALLLCFLWGYVFGWVMDFWFWLVFFSPPTWGALLGAFAASFWFDTLHALGNAGFYLLLGGQVEKLFARFRSRL